MKNSVININPDNGHIDFLNLDLSPEFKLSDLPDSFTKTEFKDKDGDYVRANIEHTEKTILYTVGLQFKENQLANISISMLHLENLEDYYAYKDDEYDYHNRWLKKQLRPHVMKHPWCTEFSWGTARLGMDKSCTSIIRIDYEENNFKRSKEIAANDKLRGCPE
jgi:hypothetical protein